MNPSLLLSLIFGMSLTGAEDWRLATHKARRLFRVGGEVQQAGEVARVRLYTMGFMKPDGADVRVFGPKGALPFQVLSTGLDLCRLAVVLKPGIDHFWVYYGCGSPGEPPEPAKIERGLILETRHFQEGDCGTWQQMQELVRRSGPSLGRDLVAQVYHGYNPFGPSDSYVSIYEGWLAPAVSGDYVFSTTSDDASFLFIDGQLAVSKPGWGPAPNRANHQSQRIPLKADRPYSFKYYHVEGTGEQAAVAAWKPPRGEFTVIPPSAFPGVHECQQAGYEIRGWPIAPDFEPVNAGEAVYQGNTYFRFEFRDTTQGEAFAYNPHWDFGDGCATDDRNPVHIYLLKGEHSVSFTLSRGGQDYRVALRLDNNCDWEKQLRQSGDNIEDYYPHLRKYNFERMKTEAIENAFAIFLALNAPEEIIKAGHVLLLRDEVLKDESKVFGYVLPYGRELCRRQKAFKEAVEAFLYASRHIREREKKAQLRSEIGDVYLFYIEDLDAALKQYESILADFGDLKHSVVRQAQIRIGEVRMRLGESGKAIAAFASAEKMPSYERKFDQKLAFLGAMPLRIENYLSRKEFDAAEEELNQWEWEYPMERLLGASTLGRARLAKLRQQYDEVVKQALILAHVTPRSKYAVELLMEAAEACELKKDPQNAVKMLERVLKEYPETPHQEEINHRLDRLRASSGKKDSGASPPTP
jgi:TolA-binding protein